MTISMANRLPRRLFNHWVICYSNFKNSENVTNYYRELDMETGIVKITYNDGDTKYTREIFMSYPDHVMVVRLTSNKPGKISLEAKLKSLYRDNFVTTSGKLVMNGTWKGPVPRSWLDSQYQRIGNEIPNSTDVDSGKWTANDE